MRRPGVRLAWCLVAALAVCAAARGQGAGDHASLVWQEVLQAQGPAALRWPVAVAAASPRELAVADAWGNRLVVFRDAGDASGWQAQPPVTLPAPPVGLAFDGARYLVSLRGAAGLYAVEGQDLRLRKLALPAGVTPGPLAALASGALLYDMTGGAVLRLDSRGAAGDATPIEGHLTGLAAAPGGGFFAAFAHGGEVRRYDAQGERIGGWQVPGVAPVPAWPTGLATMGNLLLVVDRHGGRVMAFGLSGQLEGLGARLGREPGLLLFPAAVADLGDGRLAVADQGNGRVQVFRYLAPGSSP